MCRDFKSSNVLLSADSRAVCRDLKSSNVLLSAEGVAKLADVGLATVVTNEEQTLDSITPGTWAFAAPELILGAAS
jgi:serine/threonine protein kinase